MSWPASGSDALGPGNDSSKSNSNGNSGDSNRAVVSTSVELTIRRLVRDHPKPVIALIAAGILAFGLNAFLGYRDTLEPDALSRIFHPPWPLFLWFCAVLMTMQVALLRDPSRRGPLVASLTATSASILLVTIVYFRGTGDLLPRLADFFSLL